MIIDNPTQMMTLCVSMVEVFKTSVNEPKIGNEIICAINGFFPEYKINFDLEDCDNILRIESNQGAIDVKKIIQVVENFNQTHCAPIQEDRNDIQNPNTRKPGSFDTTTPLTTTI